MSLNICTGAQCGDYIALVALSVSVLACLVAAIAVIVYDLIRSGIEDFERMERELWPDGVWPDERTE